jgi:hypothetical protein
MTCLLMIIVKCTLYVLQLVFVLEILNVLIFPIYNYVFSFIFHCCNFTTNVNLIPNIIVMQIFL